MGPVSAETKIDVPRGRAFAKLADLSLRPAFTDHFLTDFHLTRVDSSGVGAGARFRVRLPPRRLWMDTAIVEAREPQRIVERGRGGRGNRIPCTTVWELLEGPGSLITVRVSFWSEPAGRLDRAIDSLGWAATFQARAWREALRRLRDQLESGRAPRSPVALAGRSAHAAGIP